MTIEPATRQTAVPDPDRIRCWIFDLDNTLYPAASNLFARVSVRMTRFIQDRFDLEEDRARSLQKDLFRRHGTTMRGLMVEHGTDPDRFMDYVHDIDVSDVAPNPRLAGLLGQLPGRRYIFTNGSIAHAERITGRLGLAGLFDGMFDIAAADYIPKPDPRPYDTLINRFDIAPGEAVMIEDIAGNLVPAAALGMTTVWLRNDAAWSVPGPDDACIDFQIDDLADWLAQVLEAGNG